MAIDAIVLAGGRIAGIFARAAGTRVKALVRVGGKASVARVVEALAGVAALRRICVVGPESVREVVSARAEWLAEAGSALGNLHVGLDRLRREGAGSERVLVCGADVPLVTAAAVSDLIARAPAEADLCLPVVRREAFVATFPGNLGIYVRLAEGAFTAGSQILARPDVLLANRGLAEPLFRARKSQLAMARRLGARFLWRLVTHRLTLAEIEARASELAGCRCRAVLDAAPALAFDLDSVLDLRYAERWLARYAGEGSA